MECCERTIDCQTILVVDDEPDELVATSRILQKAGYRVEQAASGREAYEKSKLFRPELILLDVVMPDIDGVESCRLIKSDPQLTESFVILVSGLSNTPEQQARGLDAGADGFIARPFHTQEFLSRIASMMRIKNVEKELRLQRQWLRVTMSSIGDGLIATDGLDRILFMNPVAEKLIGWTLEEARYKKSAEVFRIVTRSTGEPVKSPLVKVMQDGMILELDDNVLLVCKDGTRRAVADSAAPIRQDDGSIIGGVLVFRDISEQLAAEQKMDKTLKEWGVMFRAIGQMALIIDSSHTILHANDTVLEKTGLSQDDIVGEQCYRLIHGSDCPPDNCPLVKTLRSRRQESSDMVIERFNGDYLVSCTPVTDTVGQIEKVVHVATDISARKKAERQLQESEHKYRTLFQSSSDAKLLVDVQSLQILDANEAAIRLYGYSHEELTKLKAPNVSEEKEETIQAIQGAAASAIPVRYHRKRDGTVFPVEITMNFFSLQGKEIALGSVRDISRRKQLEEEKSMLERHLRQAQKMEAVGTLAGGIAHDFNNILSTILGNAELALEDAQEGNDLKDNLQEISVAGRRAAELVKQILTFARHSDESLEPVRIGPILKEIAKFITASIPSSIEISCHVHSDASVLANPTQIHQVMMNLCTNAAQAMEHDGGSLAIQMDLQVLDEHSVQQFPELKPGRHVRIRVSDTGHGIAEDMMESIFEPYFTTKRQGEGTGMGLAVVHGIIRRHSGCIRVESETGRGTTFSIFLPVTDDILESDQPVAEDVPKGGEQILFLDDEASIVRLGTRILESLGYRVTATTNSLEALALFEAQPEAFDLVITDMTMPKMNGDALAAEMLSIRPDIPIILCTGYSKKMTPEKAEQIGIMAFAFKPLVKADLANTVRAVLDGRRSALCCQLI